MEAEKGHLTKAKELFTKGCGDGAYLNGCVNSGTIESRKGNKASAKHWLKMSCDGGEASDCCKLGIAEIIQDLSI